MGAAAAANTSSMIIMSSFAMNRLRFLSFLLSLSAVSAVPGLVWKNNNNNQQVLSASSGSVAVQHHSEVTHAKDWLQQALAVSTPSSSTSDVDNKENAVVFVIGRNQKEGGAEGLTSLLEQARDQLPGLAAAAETAASIHYHVSHVESAAQVTRDAHQLYQQKMDNAAGKKSSKKPIVKQVSWQDYVPHFTAQMNNNNNNNKHEEMEISVDGSSSSSTTTSNNSARSASSKKMDRADCLVVEVPYDSAVKDATLLDQAVTQAATTHGRVLLSAVRSIDQVKHDRAMHQRARRRQQEKAGAALQKRRQELKHRRLEDANNNGGDNDNGNDTKNIYYVSMTPNILAGLLFFLLFAVTTWIGVTCMGAIQGQDVYVTKMPVIGREA